MSTRSAIGIKYDDNKYMGIYCHYDGYLENNGIKLNTSYKEKNKVESLMALGNLISLGHILSLPRIQFKDFMDKAYCKQYSRHVKTSFCDPYGDEDEKCLIFKSEKDFVCGIDGAYNYLFDTTDNQWYVVEYDNKADRTVRFNLNKLLTNKDYHYKWYMEKNRFWIEFEEELGEETGIAQYEDCEKNCAEEWERIIKAQSKIKEEKSDSLVDICNKWLNEIGKNKKLNTSVIEFGISNTKEMGNHYIILDNSRKDVSKRKALIRSKNPNDLTLAVCNQFGLNLYERPFFENYRLQ